MSSLYYFFYNRNRNKRKAPSIEADFQLNHPLTRSITCDLNNLVLELSITSDPNTKEALRALYKARVAKAESRMVASVAQIVSQLGNHLQ